MTTFTLNDCNGKGVHALVIGTGKYPYIETRRSDLPFEFRSLRPLETAPASALAVTDWLFKKFNPPDRKLCTVELLVNDPRDPDGNVSYAPPGSNSSSVTVEHPTMDNVFAAFRKWKHRCDSSPDNMAIFYICGHGFWHGSMLALLEDTGASDEKDWFAAAIAFDTFVQNMVQCNAETQVFIADCCQDLAATAATYIGTTPGNPLIKVFSPGNLKRGGLVVKAAQPGLSAHAPEGYREAYVTQAVLAGLNGRAGESGPNGWRVTCGKMVEAVDKVLMEFEDTDPQFCEPRPIGRSQIDLHQLPDTPNVPVRIQCNPDYAIHAAEVSLSNPDGTVLYNDRSIADKAWKPGVVRPGEYYASAFFPMSNFRNVVKEQVIALPPLGECWLTVEP